MICELYLNNAFFCCFLWVFLKKELIAYTSASERSTQTFPWASEITLCTSEDCLETHPVQALEHY